MFHSSHEVTHLTMNKLVNWLNGLIGAVIGGGASAKMKTLLIFLLPLCAIAQAITPVIPPSPMVTPILTVTITGTSSAGVAIYGQLSGSGGFVVTDFLISPSGNLVALMTDKAAPIPGYTARYVAGWVPGPTSGQAQPPLLIVYTED